MMFLMEEELLEVEIGLNNDAALPLGGREILREFVGASWEGRQIRLLSWEQLEQLTMLQERFPALSIKVHGATLTKISVNPQDN